ncbi:two pore domain potassium channel family protein [Leucobacter sp. cx-42]|nr:MULTISPECIES: ion channel [unclassified Leucobacter]MBC9955321.1 two pore domain potassium channel family protein [Leucobacter sp. cx-42]
MFRRSGNLFRLLALLLIVAVVCALGIYTVATELPGQFSGIETRIDALYFTLTTMTTTGYGDIHAVGQLARVIVSCIFFFDLLFVGLVGVELSRIAQRQHEGSEPQVAEPADQEAPSATPESPEPHVSSESLSARDTFAASDLAVKKSDPADTHAEAPVPTSEITPEPVSGQPTVQTKPDGIAE